MWSIPHPIHSSLHHCMAFQYISSDVVNELDLLTLVRDASRVTVGPKGGTLSSPLTDFEITVPAGAVQDQVTITAATSAWGSFNIPNDVYRISDYICVTSTGHLSASVTIQIAHCLSMPEYRSTPAIVIYHADLTHYKPSEGFRFTLLDAIPHVSSTKPFVSFEVQEFCIFCAVYRPQHYRGTQKQASSHSSRGAHSRPGPVSPYDRPTIPRLDYVLLYYEQKLVTADSPYKVQIFSCINCPGAIEVSIIHDILMIRDIYFLNSFATRKWIVTEYGKSPCLKISTLPHQRLSSWR